MIGRPSLVLVAVSAVVMVVGLALVGTAAAQSPNTPDAPNAPNMESEPNTPYTGNPADAGDLMEAAAGLFQIGNYAGAAKTYEDVVASGIRDAVLYYNLGVSHLRSGRPALAVLDFRRALALDPSDRDARANLDIVRRELDIGAPPGESALTRFANSVVGVIPAWVLGTAALVGALAAVFLWAVFRVARRRALGEAAAYGVAVLALVIGFALLVVAVDAGRDRGQAVVPRTASLYSGPGTGYVDLLSVPAGAEVSVVDERDGWLRLALPPTDRGDGAQGWVRRASVEMVLP